jgi:hypothetical protein
MCVVVPIAFQQGQHNQQTTGKHFIDEINKQTHTVGACVATCKTPDRMCQLLYDSQQWVIITHQPYPRK